MSARGVGEDAGGEVSLHSAPAGQASQGGRPGQGSFARVHGARHSPHLFCLQAAACRLAWVQEGEQAAQGPSSQ